MRQTAWLSPDSLSGYNTFVTEKSHLGLPVDEDQEKQQVLPPGSATPKVPKKDAGTDTRVLPYSQFTKPDDTTDIYDRPRTLGVPGGDEDHPYKEDYGYVTRRVMTGYERRIPWKRQKKQDVWTRLEDKREYQQNKSKILPRMKRWYKAVKNNMSFHHRRDDYKDDPAKHKRQKVSYTPRHHQRGLAKRQRHQNYVHNRARAKLQSRKWYQRNKHKPQFKRKQHLRHQHPQRYRLRYGSVTEPISFVVGPLLQMGYVVGIQNGLVVFDVPDTVGVVYMHPLVFVHSVVFLGDGDIDRVYALLDQDPDVYVESPDMSDVEDAVILHDMNPESKEFRDFLVTSIGTTSLNHAGPDDLMRVCDALVRRQTLLSDSIEKVAGGLLNYEKKPPESSDEKQDAPQRSYKNTAPDQWTNIDPNTTHTPTPADIPSPDPVVPGSGSGKVIPDTLRPYG